MADAAAFEPDDPHFLALRDDAIHLIDDYCINVWKPNHGRPGRREVNDRDELIDRLAKAFHDRSGWAAHLNYDNDPEYPKEYQGSLEAFIKVLLSDYDSIPFPAVGLLEKITAKFRKPRA